MNKHLMIIGITRSRGGIDKIKRFCEDMGVNYPIVIGDYDVYNAYGGIRFIPTTFIINKEGKIVKKYTGYTDFEVFETQVKNLL